MASGVREMRKDIETLWIVSGASEQHHCHMLVHRGGGGGKEVRRGAGLREGRESQRREISDVWGRRGGKGLGGSPEHAGGKGSARPHPPEHPLSNFVGGGLVAGLKGEAWFPGPGPWALGPNGSVVPL